MKKQQKEKNITRLITGGIRYLPLAIMLTLCVSNAFGQNMPAGNATQIGSIARWLLWVLIAPLLAVMGAFKLVGAWGMWGNGQQGWVQKGVAGLGFMMFPALLDLALQLARGETPDLGLSNLFGGN